MRRDDLRRVGAGEDAQDVAGRDDEDVEERDLLEAERVEDGDRRVDERGPERRGGRERDDGERERPEDRGERERAPRGQRSRRDGPEPLDGVLSIRLGVADVVQEVEGRGERAERRPDDDGAAGEVSAVRDLAEKDGREDEEVLDPLGRPEGLDDRESNLSGNTGMPRSVPPPRTRRSPI